jgi:hypothetical protein
MARSPRRSSLIGTPIEHASIEDVAPVEAWRAFYYFRHAAGIFEPMRRRGQATIAGLTPSAVKFATLGGGHLDRAQGMAGVATPGF